MNKPSILAILLLLAIGTLFLSPFFGQDGWTSLTSVVSGNDPVAADIFWKIRVPRILTAFLAGWALAIRGMAFQALFRNPLATPYTLGVSFGGFAGTIALGAMLAAFLGAGLSILLVYGLTLARKGFSTYTMLLAGVAVSFFFSSLILFLQYLSNFTQMFRILRWLMGGFEIVGYRPALSLLPFAVGGSITIWILTRELNLLATGEDIAASRGVNVKRTRHWLFLATSLMVGAVVSVCGPIGFVGMMAPHICRLLIGADHRWLGPATMLFGGLFLTLCDTLGRTLIAPAEIPTGVITALLGGPFFLWLLLRGRLDDRLF
jgi:iron complex transport system permease protein